jgi:hypothetical protein
LNVGGIDALRRQDDQDESGAGIKPVVEFGEPGLLAGRAPPEGGNPAWRRLFLLTFTLTSSFRSEFSPASGLSVTMDGIRLRCCRVQA